MNEIKNDMKHTRSLILLYLTNTTVLSMWTIDAHDMISLVSCHSPRWRGEGGGGWGSKAAKQFQGLKW